MRESDRHFLSTAIEFNLLKTYLLRDAPSV